MEHTHPLSVLTWQDLKGEFRYADCEKSWASSTDEKVGLGNVLRSTPRVDVVHRIKPVPALWAPCSDAAAFSQITPVDETALVANIVKYITLDLNGSDDSWCGNRLIACATVGYSRLLMILRIVAETGCHSNYLRVLL